METDVVLASAKPIPNRKENPVITKSKTDVLIVGAGPTGLALAIALQRAGVDYR